MTVEDRARETLIRYLNGEASNDEWEAARDAHYQELLEAISRGFPRTANPNTLHVTRIIPTPEPNTQAWKSAPVWFYLLEGAFIGSFILSVVILLVRALA